ncbi:MAG: hypothetical protein R2710_12965 [Acidimicrobiales bacterium]
MATSSIVSHGLRSTSEVRDRVCRQQPGHRRSDQAAHGSRERSQAHLPGNGTHRAVESGLEPLEFTQQAASGGDEPRP